jgi:hypothetical protein
LWAHIWALMQPPPTFNFGLTSNFFLFTAHSVCGKKTKNHQNQVSIDKKFDFFPQSLTHIPRWVHLVQKTRANNSHAWAPLRFTLRCRQADFVSCVSWLVLLLLAINYCWCCCYRRLIIAGVVVNLIAGVMESMKIQKKALLLITTTPAIIYRRCH